MGTPIVAITAYSGADINSTNLFAASLLKPVQKVDLVTVMRQLGFRTSTEQNTKVVSRS